MADHQNNDNQALPASLRGLSYPVHTNRELEFMLKGIKPLAYFYDMIFDDYDMWEEEEEFARHVASGVLVKHEEREAWEPYSYNGHLIKGRWIRFYAVKDEAWRIPAFLLLRKIQDKHVWNDALERLQGSLLGYTDAQNDEWLAKHRERSAGWGCLTLYALTTRAVLDEIEELGRKALPKTFFENPRLFFANSVPTRPALDEAGLLAGDDTRLIRFGVQTKFAFANFQWTPVDGLSAVSIREDMATRDFNGALRTDIQVMGLDEKPAQI